MRASAGLGSLGHLRWSLAPLLRYTHTTPYGFARRYGLSASSVRTAHRDGLNDRQADHWALAAGVHPALIWGRAWFDAALANEEAMAS